jgi:DNA polymerase IIIc chi subunit
MFKMQNGVILACCLAAMLLVSTLTVAVTTVVPALANESNAIMKILDTANAEANDELQELRQRGVEIPQEADSLYSAALSEREAARQAFETGDAASARVHTIKALDLFRNLFDLLATLEQRGEDDSSLIDAIDQDISNLQTRADNLKGLAAANNISIDFASYSSAISASADALSDGNLEEAEDQFALAQELLQDIHNHIQQAVQADSGKNEKAKEFALKTAQRLGRIVVDLKENSSIPNDLRSTIVQRLESTIAELENETDIEKIIEITEDSSELQRAINQYNSYRIENFEMQYLDIQEDIAALVANARALNIRIQSSEIDGLLDSTREKIQAGQQENAAEELDRLDSLLDEIEDIVEEFSEVIEGIAETRATAMALRSEAAGNARALEEVGRAIALLENADSKVKEAAQAEVSSETIRGVHAQMQLAVGLTQEANDILEEVEESLAEEQDGRPPGTGMNNTMTGYRG